MANPTNAEDSRHLRWAYTRILWLGATILALLAVGLMAIPILQPPDRRGGLGFTISLALGINFLSGAVGAALFELLIRRPKEGERPTASRADLRAIHSTVSESTTQLSGLAQSLARVTAFVDRHDEFHYIHKLDALDRAGISEVYATRRDASPAMALSFGASHITEIRLLGVTLTEFVRAGDGPWSVIEEYLTGDRSLPDGSTHLSVKVLVSDPEGVGVRLFAAPSPSGAGHPRVSTLQEDVRNVSARMRALQHILASRNAPAARNGSADGERAQNVFDLSGPTTLPVKLEFRFCRVTPHFFLISTNFTTYMQPYYLSQQASPNASMVVLQYGSQTAQHHALTRHFDTLWVYSSADPTEVLDRASVGVEHGASESGLTEIFTSGTTARTRMVALLNSAKRRVWMQGLALIPILSGNLEGAFEAAAHRAGVDIRILLLDPLSEACFRKSYVAHLKGHSSGQATGGWTEYVASGAAHRLSNIYNNIIRSRDWFNDLEHALPPGKMAVRLAQSVEGFVLIVDDVILIEPYHYGGGLRTHFPSQTPLQLAEDLPAFEFHSPSSSLFPRSRDRSNPVEIFSRHFERVFEDFSNPADGR
jgi:hypothetical protein